jgi:hypothetical protein
VAGGDVLLEGWWDACLPHPDEHGALLVNGETLGGDELGFQVLKHIIVQIELAFERPIGHATSLAQERNRLIDHTIKIHGDPFYKRPL